jgi:hypothetical protein
LAIGKPVLSTPLPDVIKHAKKFVDFVNNEKDYLRNIINYTRKPEVYKNKAKLAKEEIRKNRNWNTISNIYEKLIFRFGTE